jgi:acyl carrier protein
MTETEIVEGIAGVARKALDWDGELSAETPLVSALELDSLRMLTLVVELEDHFRVCLEEGDEQDLATVGDLASLLRRRLDEQSA